MQKNHAARRGAGIEIGSSRDYNWFS